MSLIKASTSIQQVKPEEVPRFVDIFAQDVVRVVNGALDFQTNFNGKIISVVFPSANTTVSANHGLSRVPTGYVVLSLTAAMIVFNGSGSSDTGIISLQSSAAGAASILVF